MKFTERIPGLEPGQEGHGDSYYGINAPAPTIEIMREWLLEEVAAGQGTLNGKHLANADSNQDLTVTPVTVKRWARALLCGMARSFQANRMQDRKCQEYHSTNHY